MGAETRDLEGGDVQMKEGDWEGQELTTDCVLTTPSRSLMYNHDSFKYSQDQNVCL
jgi:hypothetical protein